VSEDTLNRGGGAGGRSFNDQKGIPARRGRRDLSCVDLAGELGQLVSDIGEAEIVQQPRQFLSLYKHAIGRLYGAKGVDGRLDNGLTVFMARLLPAFLELGDEVEACWGRGRAVQLQGE
jgi:hypothetical protein